MSEEKEAPEGFWEDFQNYLMKRFEEREKTAPAPPPKKEDEPPQPKPRKSWFQET